MPMEKAKLPVRRMASVMKMVTRVTATQSSQRSFGLVK